MPAEDVPGRAELRDLVERIIAGWNHHDSAEFAAPFAEDAEHTNVFGMATKGRENIDKWHDVIFKSLFKDSHVSVTGFEVRFIRPDVASLDVRWEMTGAVDPRGNKQPLRRGLMNLIATQRDEEWMVDVFHNMDLPAAEAIDAIERLKKR